MNTKNKEEKTLDDVLGDRAWIANHVKNLAVQNKKPPLSFQDKLNLACISMVSSSAATSHLDESSNYEEAMIVTFGIASLVHLAFSLGWNAARSEQEQEE